jgi:predicted transcriptional regulator
MSDKLRKPGMVSRTYLITHDLDKKLDELAIKLGKCKSKIIRELIAALHKEAIPQENWIPNEETSTGNQES